MKAIQKIKSNLSKITKVLRHGILSLYSYIRKFVPWRSRTYIQNLRHVRIAGVTSSFLFGLLALAIIIPLYNVSGTEDTEATTGTAKDSNITFTSTRNTASVTFSPTSTSGTFASSTAGTSDAAFSLSTTNSQGYTLKLKSSNGTTLKTSTSATDTATLSAITSSGIESGSFATNTWGYLPNYYNSTTNTTKYYPATTTDITLRTTSSANATNTSDSYTIGIGAKADLTREAGTYTLGGNSSSMVLSYAVNPTAYSIDFDKGNAAGTVSDLPSTQSGSVSATSVTLSSATPTQSGYTFKGWCLGTVSTSNGVDTCTGTTFAAGATFGIDRTANNEGVTLHALWDGNVYTATFYYNNKTSTGTSGTTNITNTGNTYTCRVTNTSNTCTVDIPDVVKNSVGTYNNGYVGVATATGTMSSSTTVTLSANASRYAVYRATVTLYKPSSTTARTSVTLYRNQWFTSSTALATTVLSDSTTGTSNYSYSSSVSGYAMYGFSASTNTATRTYTNVASMADTDTTTFYAIDYDSDGASATFYYNNNTTTNSCTTASVTSTTGTAARYLYTTSSAATTTSGEAISVPSVVSNSKGTCGMAYKNVGTSTSDMTAATPTAGNTYYARYSQTLTNVLYRYSGSAYGQQTLYRNQRVNGTATSNVSAIVLSTSATGTSNYSTATGPGSSVWTGLATSSTTTVGYSTVAAAATASSVYTSGTTHFYTIYQFNVTFAKGTNTSSIGATSGSCKINATGATTGGTSCTVAAPNISAPTGYSSAGWSTTKDATSGTAAGSNIALSTNAQTYYGNVKINTYNLVITGDSHVSAVSVKKGSTSGTSTTCTKSGTKFTCSSLTYGTNYYLYPTFSSGYEFSSWAKTDSATNASLGSTSTMNTYYKMGAGAGALTLASKSSCQTSVSGTMQAFNPCSSIADGTSGTLTDSRDNKTYTVKKINGQWWMTQNLAIGCNGSGSSYGSSVSSKSLTSSNSNVSTTWSTPTALLSAASSSTQTADYTDPRMQCSSTYGAWYNYAAATAGTITGSSNSTAATKDICPAGWHLPTGPSTTSGTDFNILVGNTTSGWQSATTGLNAFSAVAGGRYVNGSLDGTGLGYWWSATAYGTTNRYTLSYDSSNSTFYGNYSLSRYRGLFVRCVRSS